MEFDLDALMERVYSKYEMVVLAARRARQLTEGAPSLVETHSRKPVSMAFEEMAEGEIDYRAQTGRRG